MGFLLVGCFAVVIVVSVTDILAINKLFAALWIPRNGSTQINIGGATAEIVCFQSRDEKEAATEKVD